MNWIKVSDKLPSFNKDVLALFEMDAIEIGEDDEKELWPENKHFYIVAQIQCQFKTGKPIWVTTWDHVQIEDVNLIATHWMELPELP